MSHFTQFTCPVTMILHAGLFVSLMLRFDSKNGSGKVYFFSAMVGYVIGLIATLVVMQTFKAAQPALLYIVPGVVGCVMLQAAARGEISQLLGYTEEEESQNVASGEKSMDGTVSDVDSITGAIEVKKDK